MDEATAKAITGQLKEELPVTWTYSDLPGYGYWSAVGMYDGKGDVEFVAKAEVKPLSASYRAYLHFRSTDGSRSRAVLEATGHGTEPVEALQDARSTMEAKLAIFGRSLGMLIPDPHLPEAQGQDG